jgi:thiosulfate/3-mercaptopyruvate sulfurtransferase
MPALKRDPYAEFLQKRIPSSVFFDVDKVADLTHFVPHMLPSPDVFAEAAGKLGICETDAIVVYDTQGIMSAPRTWYTFKTFGAKDVFILEGGLPAWGQINGSFETGSFKVPTPKTFRPSFDPLRVRNFEQINAFAQNSLNKSKSEMIVVDARSAGRFAGTDPEPRAGLKSGSIPGSLNVPFSEVYSKDSNGNTILKSKDELTSIFTRAGLNMADTNKPITLSCGSGMTACSLYLALNSLGFKNLSVYDGSWTEFATKTQKSDSK